MGSVYELANVATLDAGGYAAGAGQVVEADKAMAGSAAQVAGAVARTGETLASTERVLTSHASQVERLNRTYIEGYQAQAKIEQALRGYERGLGTGQVGAQQAMAGLQGIANKYGATFTAGGLQGQGYTALALALTQFAPSATIGAKAANELGEGFEISAREAKELSRSVGEVATALAMGVPPVQAMSIEGLRLSGMLGGSKLAFAAWGAGIAAIVGTVALLVEHWRALNEEAERFETTSRAFNTGFGASSLQGMANTMMQSGPFGRSDIDTALVEMARSPEMPASLGPLVARTSVPLAQATGQQLPAAMKELVQDASQGYAGIMRLEEAYTMLTPAEMAAARGMVESGHGIAAMRMAIEALDKQMSDAADHAEGPTASAWERAGKAWSKALDDVVAKGTLLERIFAAVGEAAAAAGDFTASVVNQPGTVGRKRGESLYGLPASWFGESAPAYDPLSSVNAHPAGWSAYDPLTSVAAPSGDAASVADRVKAQDIAARSRQTNAALSQGGVEGERAQVEAEYTQAVLAGTPAIVARAEAEEKLGAIDERANGTRNETIRTMNAEAEASRLVAQAYTVGEAAAEKMRIEQEAGLDALTKGGSGHLALAAAIAKETAAVEANITANAKRIGQLSQEGEYRQREINAAGQSPGALQRQQAIDEIDRRYRPQIEQAQGVAAAAQAHGDTAGATRANQEVATLTAQQIQEELDAQQRLADAQKMQSATVDQGLERELQERQEVLAAMNQGRGTVAQVIADQRIYDELVKEGYDTESQAFRDELDKRKQIADQIASTNTLIQQQQAENERWQSTLKSVTDEVGNSFEQAIQQGKSFHDVVKSLEQDLANLIMKLGVMNPLQNALTGATTGTPGNQPTLESLFSGNAGGGGNSIFGSLFGTGTPDWLADTSGVDQSPSAAMGDSDGGDIFSGISDWIGNLFAGGGVMSGRGPVALRRYAGGGVAYSPQLAMFAEGATPEAYVPLADGRSIPVTMSGGGGASPASGNVTVHNWNIDARGADPAAAARLDQIERRVSQLNGSVEARAVNAVMSAQYRGVSLSPPSGG